MTVILALSHTTHLLTLLADYLSLKLPHEISPPSRGTVHHSIRLSSSTKPLSLSLPAETLSASSRVWTRDKPDGFVSATALLARNIAWVLWAQGLWTRTSESTNLGGNLVLLVTSPGIGNVSDDSTLGFEPRLAERGEIAAFELGVGDVEYVIWEGLEEQGGRKGSGEEGGEWDLVEGGEEVMRGEGWLKLNSVSQEWT
jgi:Vacuolar sorting 38 and autophagy-related subunit 14